MCHRVFVAIPQTLEHLPTQRPCIVLRIILILSYPMEQISAGHEFHDKEVAFSLFEKVNKGTNEGISKHGEDEYFVVYCGVVVGGQIFSEDAFDGDFPARDAMRASADGGVGSRF